MPDQETDAEFTAPIVAHVLGITEQRLGQLVKEGMPKNGRGKYPLAGCVQWFLEYWKKRANAGDLIDQARARKLRTEARLFEIKLAEAEGKVCTLETIEAAWVDIITAARAKFLSLPNKMAPFLAAENSIPACEAVIEKGVHEALSELARGDDIRTIAQSSEPSGVDGEKGNKKVRAAAKVKRKRLGGSKKKVKPGKQRRARKLDNKKG